MVFDQLAQNGHVEIVRELLTHNADPNLTTWDDSTSALFMAAQEGHAQVVKLLLEFRADPDHQTSNDGTTACFMASQVRQKKKN